MTEREANTHQIGGDHYKKTEIEHWDLVDYYGWDYFQGQVVKYVMRWRNKNGVEDLKKARHYLDKYIECQTRGNRIKILLSATETVRHLSSDGHQQHLGRKENCPKCRPTVESEMKELYSGIEPGPGYVDQDEGGAHV